MALIDAQVFYKQIDQGQFSPLYLFYGAEDYLVHQAQLRIKDQFAKTTSLDFNYDCFYAQNTSVDQIVDSVLMLPVFAERRLVIIKDAHLLKDNDWEQLLPVIERPVESSILVFVAADLDKRKKWHKKILEKANTLEFKKAFDNQMAGWIRYLANMEGLKLNDEAIALVHRRLGNNLAEIASELTKLSLYLSGRQLVEVADIEACMTNSREENVFSLATAIGQRQKVQALEDLQKLLSQGQSEVGVLAIVARQVRILLALKKAHEGGEVGASLAQAAGVPPYFLNQYLAQTKLWTRSELESAVLAISHCDKELKSSGLRNSIWLENFILSHT